MARSRPEGPSPAHEARALRGGRPAAATAGVLQWSRPRRRRGNGGMQTVPSTSQPELRLLDPSGRSVWWGPWLMRRDSCCLCGPRRHVLRRAIGITGLELIERPQARAQRQCRTKVAQVREILGRGGPKVRRATVIVALPTTFLARTPSATLCARRGASRGLAQAESAAGASAHGRLCT
jgi:hypothetical protein